MTSIKKLILNSFFSTFIFTLALVFLFLLLGCIEKSIETTEENISTSTSLIKLNNITRTPLLDYYLYYEYAYSFPKYFPNYPVYDEYGKTINFLTQKNFVRTDYNKKNILFLTYITYGSDNELYQFIEAYDSEKSAKNRASRGIINFALRGWSEFTFPPEQNSSRHEPILNREVLCGILHSPFSKRRTKAWYVCQFKKENMVIAIADESKKKTKEFTKKLIKQMNENKTKEFSPILLPSNIEDYKLLSYSAKYNNPETIPKKIVEGTYLVKDKIARIRIEDWGRKGIESWVKEIEGEKNKSYQPSSYREINGARCIILNFTHRYIYRCVLSNFTVGVYLPYNESFSVVGKEGDKILKNISNLDFNKGFSASIKTCYEKSNVKEKERCFAHIAMEEKNPERCEMIKNQTIIKDNCYSNLAYEEPDLCEKISQQRQRDLCYYSGAEGIGNSNFCKEIKSEELKERCYYETRWMEKYGFHP